MCIPVNREFRCVLNHIFSLLFFSVAVADDGRGKLGRQEAGRRRPVRALVCQQPGLDLCADSGRQLVFLRQPGICAGVALVDSLKRRRQV